MLRPTSAARLAVVSPHLDDAVMSCGTLLAREPGSVVCTVFTAGPRCTAQVTPWDRAAGFVPGDSPMRVRRAEDADALALLRAEPVWLDHVAEQYGGVHDHDALVRTLIEHLRRVDVAVVPLGLWHHDHVAVGEACLDARAVLRTRGPDIWVAYADVPHRSIDDGAVLSARLDELAGRGLSLVELAESRTLRTSYASMDEPTAAAHKRRAVQRYRSQLQALCAPGMPGLDDVLRPEQRWRISGRATT